MDAGTSGAIPIDRGRRTLGNSAAGTNAEVLARIRADDVAALDELVSRYWSPVLRYAAGFSGAQDEAVDIAQETFCRLWEKRARWHGEGSVRGLLFRLARNAAVSGRRKGQARERATRAFAVETVQHCEPLKEGEDAELRAALEHAVAALPARRREALVLRMVHDLSYNEIAAVMGISQQTVANQLSQALATLRRTLAHLLD